MNAAMRRGKCSELIVAGQVIRYGLDVYVPCVDDQAIDLVVRVEHPGNIRFYDIQVKSVRGYNRIIGVKNPDKQHGNYVLVIHYRHDLKADEFFYLTRDQISLHHLASSAWGDLVFNRQEREQYRDQTLMHLAETLLDPSVQAAV